MNASSTSELVLVLQQAVSPVILISGVGLLLLSMSNRLGRSIDRSRILSAELPRADAAKREKIIRQLHLLWKRARIIRLCILLASNSAFCAAVLILTLFLTAWLKIELGWLIVTLFVGCLGCLIGSLIVFTHDINLSLAALKVELADEGTSES